MICSKCKKDKSVGRIARWYHQKAEYEDVTMVRYEQNVSVAEYFL